MTARDEWAPEEVQRLRAMWPLHTARECAQALGRGVDSVRAGRMEQDARRGDGAFYCLRTSEVANDAEHWS